MIDAYKIEEATKDYINKNNYFAKYEEEPCVDIEFAYKAGAKWAINEFLKDLWHPASEEPENKDVNIAYLDKYGLLEALYFERSPIENWDEKVSIYQIDKWTYLSDLLPKEGGNHD